MEFETISWLAGLQNPRASVWELLIRKPGQGQSG